MVEFRDLPNAAAATSTACAHYLLRTTALAARTAHLYEQLLGCVARRQLAPGTLQSSLTRHVRANAEGCGERVTAAAARLLTGLASCALLPAADDEPAPAIDPSDVAASIERLREYAAQRNARAMDSWQSQLAEVAAGTLTPYRFGRAISRQHEQAIAGELSRLAGLWFEFLADVEEARARLADGYLLAELRHAAPIGFDAGVVELAGPLDTTVTAVLSLENTRPERARVRCSVGDVRRADGVGPAFAPDIILMPPAAVLEQHDAMSLRLSLRLDPSVYEAGVPYIGALQLVQATEPVVDLPLRITPEARRAS
jgi:hypothetical protein